MLTCKSLFGLGYRGERLIEPSSIGGLQSQYKLWLVGEAALWQLGSQDRQIAGTSRHAVDTARLVKASRAPVVLGKVIIQQIGTIGSQALQVFSKPMGAVHRLNVGRGCASQLLRYSRLPQRCGWQEDPCPNRWGESLSGVGVVLGCCNGTKGLHSASL